MFFAFSFGDVTSTVNLLLWHFCRHDRQSSFKPWQ